MGWLDGWSGTTADSSSDPYNKLDAGLRDFLNQESSVKQDARITSPSPANQSNASASSSSSSHSTDGAPNTYRSKIGLTTTDVLKDKQDVSAVPKESLFQDGRYAHLWKDYRSQAEIEGASKSDQDRLADVVTAYKDRRTEIGRAALENCVDLQIVERDCLIKGSFMKKMTMCRDESKAFNRCYTMQARFLSALGYLAVAQSADEEERIQMHADKLYSEMLEREALQKEAEEQGRELPPGPSPLDAERTLKALGHDSAWARARKLAMEKKMPTNLSAYSPEKQEEIKERIKGLSEMEKELELQLIAAESRSQLEYAEQITQRMQEEKQHRDERRERGRETIGDTLRRLWGM